MSTKMIKKIYISFKVARLAWQDIKILLSGIGCLKMEHDKYKRMEMEVA